MNLCFCSCLSFYPRRESASALAFLSVIPEENLLLLSPFFLSFPKGICFSYLQRYYHAATQFREW